MTYLMSGLSRNLSDAGAHETAADDDDLFNDLGHGRGGAGEGSRGDRGEEGSHFCKIDYVMSVTVFYGAA